MKKNRKDIREWLEGLDWEKIISNETSYNSGWEIWVYEDGSICEQTQNTYPNPDYEMPILARACWKEDVHENLVALGYEYNYEKEAYFVDDVEYNYDEALSDAIDQGFFDPTSDTYGWPEQNPVEKMVEEIYNSLA